MNDDTPPFTLQRAWEDLKYAVGLILSACGLPGEIAARRMLLNRTRQEILVWLAPVEALARRILLLAALKEPTPNPPERPRRGTAIASAMRDTPPPDLSDNPADWRAVFSEWPPGVGFPRKQSAEPGMPAGKRMTDYNAYPLARRIEALVRLARDPSAAIKRMAKKIAERRAWLCFAFGAFRHHPTAIDTLLRQTQAQVDWALLNTS
jgi:hypothetical protein